MSKLELLQQLQSGDRVLRNHAMYTSYPHYTVGLHTMGMMHILCTYFADELVPVMVRHIAIHDSLYESITGDIVGPIKKQYPELRKVVKQIESDIREKYHIDSTLLPYQQHLLKLIDNVEYNIFCKNEKKLGNNSVDLEKAYIESEKQTNKSFDLIINDHELFRDTLRMNALSLQRDLKLM